jgi:hypothetical protein
MRELLPKAQVQAKLRALEEAQATLAAKDGDVQLAERLGVKLDYAGKYHTVQHIEDPLPGEEPPKE